MKQLIADQLFRATHRRPPAVVASVEPVAGLGLFFAHEWWHEGAKVLSGRKYVIRTNVMYQSPQQ